MIVQAPSSALTDVLREKHVFYEVIPHPRTESAAAEARAVGIEPDHVAKTIVLAAGDAFVRAVLPATERIDLRKAREALDIGDVHFASEETLAREYPEFELGAVPPIGGARSDQVLVDRRVMGTEFVVFEAGTHEHSLRMATHDLVEVTGATIADLCED